MILLRFLIRIPFKISNKVFGPFFLTEKCSLPVKDLASIHCLPTQLVYNKLLDYECVWVLGMHL